jgi:hypothetical protein
MAVIVAHSTLLPLQLACCKPRSTMGTAMASEYVEKRDGSYYVADTRISLDSIVYAFGAASHRKPSVRISSFSASKRFTVL